MKLSLQHILPLVLLVLSGALVYLTKLPTEPTTWAGWGSAVLAALIFSINRSVLDGPNAPKFSKSIPPPPPAVPEAAKGPTVS